MGEPNEAEVGAGAVWGGPFLHVPVLLSEIMRLLELLGRSAPLVLDCTLGGGGHAEAILGAYPEARYIGVDADPDARARAEARLAPFGERLKILPGYFDEVLAAYAAEGARERPDFILFDLGLSMYQLKASGKGFSFAADEPLDMRFSPDAGRSAAELVNRAKEEELADIIFRFGEDRNSRRIARAICEARRLAPIRSSAALAAIVSRAAPSSGGRGRIHPATRTFQALRMAVNDELGREERGLASAAELLASRGILAVISFHSLEDRVAKLLCRSFGRTRGYEELFSPPLLPSAEEIASNPASRSAKLRALRAPGEGQGDGVQGGRS